MRQLFYFYGYRLKAIRWSHGHMPVTETFEPNEEGFAAFKEYIESYQDLTTLMLVDIIEEEFHSDTMPRVFGKDRKILSERIQDKYFRETKYRTLLSQGRQKTGRKDERVLVGALTNSELITPWLNAFIENRVSLLGIQSVSTVGERLLPLLGLSDAPTLLVTQQLPWTLRQSFYDEGKLLFSRLIPTRTDSIDEYPPLVFSEIEQTSRYIQYKRLIDSEAQPQVVICASKVYADEIKSELERSETIDYTCLDVQEIAEHIGFVDEVDSETCCDTMFSYLALKEKVLRNQYAQTEDLRQYRSKFLRRTLYAVSGLMMLATFLVTSSFLVDTQLHRDGVKLANNQQKHYEQMYHTQSKELEESIDDARIMKQSVDAIAKLAWDNTTMADEILATLSQQFEKFPRMELLRLNVEYDTGAKAIEMMMQGMPSTQDSMAEPEPPDPTHPKPVVEFDAVLHGLDEDYREALRQVNMLIANLNQHEQIARAILEKPPVDITPESELSGQTGSSIQREGQLKNEFSVKIEFRKGSVNDEVPE